MADERAKRAAHTLEVTYEISGPPGVADIIAAEYADVLAEHERLKRMAGNVEMVAESFNRDVAEQAQSLKLRNRDLEQQVAELREDAERYRHLRDEVFVRFQNRYSAIVYVPTDRCVDSLCEALNLLMGKSQVADIR